MGEAKRRKQQREQHTARVWVGKHIPDNPLITTMKTVDLFSEKTKLREALVEYLGRFADDPDEIAAFAVAVTAYSVMVDGGDAEVTMDMLFEMVAETEEGRVPHLDGERAAR